MAAVKKHGVKVPLAAARRILSSRENTLRSRLQCPSTAAWYFPDNCKALSTVRYYSCSVFSLLAANNSGIYSSLLAYPFTYQQSLLSWALARRVCPFSCFYLPVEVLLPASVPIAGPRPDWQVEFQVYVSTRPVAHFCTLS